MFDKEGNASFCCKNRNNETKKAKNNPVGFNAIENLLRGYS